MYNVNERNEQMISERVKRYCSEDITLIDNYWDAVNDTTQIWACHHKNEFFRGIPVSRTLLKDIGLYYGCPANELIFLSQSEHMRLHKIGNTIRLGKNHSEDTKRRISKSKKGKSPPNKGKHHTEDAKRKISEGHKGKTMSEETRRKISVARKAYWTKMRVIANDY